MNKMAQNTAMQGPPAPAGRPRRPAPEAAQETAPDSAPGAGPDTAAAPSAPGDASLDPASPKATPAAGAAQAAPRDTGGSTKAEPQPETDPDQPPRLTESVLAQIAAAMRQGEAPLAARDDLVALHNRIAEMFTTLNDGLGAQYTGKAEADRTALSARIDQLETAVNRMEGALRIEFEPVLKAALTEALAQAAPKPRHRWRGPFAALLLAIAALAAGAWWHTPLLEAARDAAAILEARTGWQLPGL